MSRFSVFLIVLCLGIGTTTRSQRHALAQAQATFRGGIELVQLDVVVLDGNRRPVTGLTAADFTITEDGKPVAIEAFAPIVLPGPVVTSGARWTRDVAPDVVSNTRAEDGRLVVIFMDRSVPAGPPTVTARAIARAAVDALGPNDLAAVVSSSGFANELAPHNFTMDRARLLAAIDTPFVGQVAPPEMTSGGLVNLPPEMLFTGDCMCGSCVFDTVDRVATALSQETRRQKVLLFVGADIVVQEPPMGAAKECTLPIKDGRVKMLRALDRANVTVHSLDPTGLETLTRGASALPSDGRLNPARTLQRQGNLATLPDYTGGRSVTNANDPQLFVPAIFDETRAYYLIGFARKDGAKPDERRSVRVQVNRRGLTVRTRRGYYSPMPAPATTRTPGTAAETEALSGLLPQTDIPLTLGLTPRFDEQGVTMVHAMIRGTNSRAGQLNVSIGVFDPRVRHLATETQTIELAAPSGAAPPFEFTTSSLMALKPGRYEVRAGVADPVSSRAGSVYGYVDVPETADVPLSLSGVLLDASGAGTTVRRAFKTTEHVTASIQVRRTIAGAEPVSIRTRVIGADDVVAAETTSNVAATAFNAHGIAEFRIGVPVDRLSPGRFLLSIDVTAGGITAKRELPFAVVP